MMKKRVDVFCHCLHIDDILEVLKFINFSVSFDQLNTNYTVQKTSLKKIIVPLQRTVVVSCHNLGGNCRNRKRSFVNLTKDIWKEKKNKKRVISPLLVVYLHFTAFSLTFSAKTSSVKSPPYIKHK